MSLISRLPFQVVLLNLGHVVVLLPKSLMLFCHPKLFPLESVEGMLIRIQFSEFLSATCSGAICTGNLFLSKSICHPEFLVLRFSDWRSGNVLYIGLDGCALCSPKLHSAFILGVIPS